MKALAQARVMKKNSLIDRVLKIYLVKELLVPVFT
jgi:hypothetical protein